MSEGANAYMQEVLKRRSPADPRALRQFLKLIEEWFSFGIEEGFFGQNERGKSIR